MSICAPDPEHPGRYVYEYVPDHPVRLTAARLLAEVWGLVGSREALNVTLGDGASINVSVDQRVLELESLGVPRDATCSPARSGLMLCISRCHPAQLAPRAPRHAPRPT